MADSREISQVYAHGAIKGCILLNGGAAVALLSQAAEIIDLNRAGAVTAPLVIWAIGTLLGAATWLLAFLSTRYLDKSESEAPMRSEHLKTSNNFMYAGIGTVILSLTLFLMGSPSLACKLT